MSEIWNKLASLSTHSPTPGHAAHARKTAAMYSKLEHDAKQRFSAAGYKHRVNSMELSDPPLLSDLIQGDRDALEVESVTVESLLHFTVIATDIPTV